MRKPRGPESGPDLDHGQLPDVLGDSIVALMARVDDLERRLATQPKATPHAPDRGVWSGDDFSI